MARTKGKTPDDREIVYRDPTSLKAYANNARTHSPEQVAQLAASIREFGFTTPVLVDDKGIIAGHGRVAAAITLKLKRIPTLSLEHFTPEQRRAYILADNKLAMNAGWDMDLLRAELGDLSGAGFDLSLTGFGSIELADIFATKKGNADPDAAPPLEKVAISKLGDVWLLGAHRLRCGDATDRAHVTALIGSAAVTLMVTDPPYGVDYDPMWRQRATGQKVRNSGKVKNDDRADWSKAWALFPGNVAYVWHAGRFAACVQASLESTGFEIRSQIIWVKDRFALSRGHYHWRHEPLWYAVRKGASAKWQGNRKLDTVWRIEGLAPAEAKVVGRTLSETGIEQSVWEIPMTVDDGATGHGTQKPVECMRRPIEHNSVAGDLVYEPFSGSGTSIIAGEMTGRGVLAMELDPLYVDVAVRRWQAFTGKQALLEGTKKTFAAIAADRGVAKAA